MKSYEQVALEILRGNYLKEEEQKTQEEQAESKEEQVDEAAVHPDALHVKPVKVDGQTKYKVHAVGENFSSGIKVGEHLSDSELDDFSEMGGKVKHMKEEIEELDELDKDTLMRYADKALDQRRRASNRYRSEINTAQSDGEEPVQAVLDMNKKIFDKRTQGLKAVGRRLKKEEVEEFDEGTNFFRNDPLLQKIGPIRTRDNTSGRISPEDQKWGAKQVKDQVKTSIQRMKSDRKPNLPEEVEEIEEMGPGKLPRIDKKVENEYGDKLMKDFIARGGEVKQVKSPALPKNRNRMVARGSLSSGERTMTRSGGKSYTSRMEEVEEDYDQLIEEKNAFEIELPEQLIFADYLKAAQQFTESYDDAVKIADYFFANKDEGLVIEAFMRSDIEDRVKMHQKAGNQVTLPKYSTKDGKPHAEYVVTDKESGKKTKYIHHGTMRRVERMN